MKIAIYCPLNASAELQEYSRRIHSYLLHQNIHVHLLNEHSPLPEDADIYWDATCAEAQAPFIGTAKCNREWLEAHAEKICITLHSANLFALPTRSYAKSLISLICTIKARWQRRRFWQTFKAYHTLITVSEYARHQITDLAKLTARHIEVIHQGVDHTICKPSCEGEDRKNPYLLHISNDEPLKNVDRLIEAYRAIERPNKPMLRLIVPNARRKIDDAKIEVIDAPQNQEALVAQYQGAMGFVFPSLVETFAMPIITAMACGCPVVTSNSSGCAEVAGDVALMVDPYSLKSIQAALEILIDSPESRHSMRQKGIVWADQFAWNNTGLMHLDIFERMVRKPS